MILINDLVDQYALTNGKNIKQVSKEEIYQEADIISLHLPLTKDTYHLIRKETIDQFKKAPIIINTSRGEIVNEDDLVGALDDNSVGAAGVDVYQIEPPDKSPLVVHPNVFCTPHIGGNAAEAVLNMGRAAIENLQNILKV